MRVSFKNGNAVNIDVHKKHVKNITLRVYPNGAVKVSAPFGAPDAAIRNFVDSKADWLMRHVARARDKKEPPAENTVRLLGALLPFRTERSMKNGVDVLDNEVVIRTKDGSEPARVLDAWWRKTALAYYELYMDKWMEKLCGEIPARPRIRVRKMKTMWGSCTYKKGEIRFSYHLFCAPPHCVEYVVLHELAHLLYPNHGDRFKAFLTKWMPDWKERRKRLNSDSACLRE
ncbi:MAG TPA: hypothetical protein DEB31_05090 [Clostridiales bacterium]|nr:hypothetical protein [Clostridiales bacterium]